MSRIGRVLCLSLCIALCAGSLAFATGQSEARQSDVVTLTIWEHAPQFEAPLRASVEQFMELNPDIRVEYEIKMDEQYYNLLFTAIQAGAAPDLFWTHGTKTEHLGQIVAQGAAMDLTGKIDISVYPPLQADVAFVDGRLYMNPGASVGTRAVYYNKDIFDEHGLSVPTTWDEFIALNEALSENGVVPMSMAGNSFWATLFHFEPILVSVAPDFIRDATERRIPLDDPRFINALSTMVEWGQNGWYGRDYLGVDTGGQLLAFSSGRVAMTITGSWNADTIQRNNPNLNVGAFQIPDGSGVRPMVVTADSGFSIYSNTEHPDEALRLLTWLNSVEAQEIWVNTLGLVPGIPQITATNPLVQEIADHDEQVESIYTLLGYYPARGNVLPRQVFQEDLQKVLSGALTPQEFARSIDAQVDWDSVD